MALEHFVYSKHLHFDDFALEEELRAQCASQEVSQSALSYGLQYSNELTQGAEAPSEVKWISEEVGHGLYALSDLLAGTYIGEYTGLVTPNNPYFRISNYCFNYPHVKTRKALSIDAEHYGNRTRFINHSFTPNLDIRYAFHDGLYHVILVAREPIETGSQLSFNYGNAYWYLRGAPNPL